MLSAFSSVLLVSRFLSSCLAQKKSPRLWYVFLFGMYYSLNSCINLSVVNVSGSVLKSPFVMISIADGPAPQIKSCLISGSFVFHGSPVGTVSSVRIGLMSIDYFYVVPESFGPFFGCIYFLAV